MFRYKNETEDFKLSKTEIVKRLWNEHTQNHKKHLNLRLPKEGQLSQLYFQSELKDVGWLD